MVTRLFPFLFLTAFTASFAPTDEAFSRMPEGTLRALLSDKDELTKVLTYHVVQGKILAADLIGKESVKTLEGSRLPTKSLKVSKADIITGNGVVHTIDEVLVPAK